MHNIQFEVGRQLKKAEFYAEVFLRILAEIVDKFCALAGELIEVGSGLIDVVEKRLVCHELAERTLAGLGVTKDCLDLCGS